MRKKPLALLLLTAATLHADVNYCDAPCCPAPCFSSCECCEGPNYGRVTLRHLEPGGIGYDHGYTSLDLFWAQDLWANWYGFVDARGHVFNDGKWASNLGIGLRFLPDCYDMVVGGNFYWDWREARHTNFHQLGAGLEFLWPCWDVRINGYAPINRHKKLYRKGFDGFKGHEALTFKKWELGMWGVDAVLGYWLYRCDCFGLHAAVGGYYFGGDFDKHAGGGLLRAKMQFWDWVELRGQVSYDNLFHWQGQGELALTMPFGCTVKRYPRQTRCCPDILSLEERLVEQPERFEIIVTTNKKKTATAFGPNGQPLHFIFVDNTSGSNGTFEDPFPTLLEAQNASRPTDIIYVFPGDGTDKGMNLGITLQDDQIFTSSFLPFAIHSEFGNFVIPALSSTRPNISNSGGVVGLANRNTVQGFIMKGIDKGVFGSGPIEGLTLFNNIINVSSDIGDLAGVFFEDTFSGKLIAKENKILAFSSMGQASGIYFFGPVSNGDLQLNNNDISAASVESFAFGIVNTDLFDGNFQMIGNDIQASTQVGFAAGLFINTYSGNLVVRSNNISATSSDVVGGQVMGIFAPVFEGNLTLQGNNILAETQGTQAFGLVSFDFTGSLTSSNNNIVANAQSVAEGVRALPNFIGTFSSTNDAISVVVAAPGLAAGIEARVGGAFNIQNDTINATSGATADGIIVSVPPTTIGSSTIQSNIITTDSSGSNVGLFVNMQNPEQSVLISDNEISTKQIGSFNLPLQIFNNGAIVQATVENNLLNSESITAPAFQYQNFSGTSHLRLIDNTIQAPNNPTADGEFFNTGVVGAFEIESPTPGPVDGLNGVESINNNARLTDDGNITYVPLAP